jgi:hypothetical protein
MVEKSKLLSQIEHQLLKTANSNSTTLTHSHIQDLIDDIIAGNIDLYGELVDIIEVTNGEEETIATLDRTLAHIYYNRDGSYTKSNKKVVPGSQQLLHRCVNSFVITPSKHLIIMQRYDKKDPSDSRKRTSNAFGGHVSSSRKSEHISRIYDDSNEKELTEELEFAEGYKLQGTFDLIGEYGQFGAARQHDNERKSVYMYFSTPGEEKWIDDKREFLNKKRIALSDDIFAEWLDHKRKREPGHWEIFAIHKIPLIIFKELGSESKEKLKELNAGKTLRYFLQQEDILESIRQG